VGSLERLIMAFFSKKSQDYIGCILLLIAARLIYGRPSFAFKAINIITFCIFTYDKYQGLNNGYRVAENILFISSLFGGWVGGSCAMLVFRHKTLKNSFVFTMTIIAIVNVLAVIYFGKW